MKFNPLIIVQAFPVLACTQNYLPCTPNEDLWEKSTTIEIRNGYTFCNTTQNLGIRFKEVVSDSRCPVNADCIWAGEVTVAFEIVKGEEIVKGFELSDQQGTTEIEINGNIYVIKLLQVNPYPYSFGAIEQRSYSVELEITPE